MKLSARIVISLITVSSSSVPGQEENDAEYGFIDRGGAVVLRDGWIDAGDFSEGVAGVRNATGRWGLIDSGGQLVVPHHWRNLPICQEGAIKIREDRDSEEGMRFGFADKTGRMILGFQWEFVSDFHEGLAEITPPDSFQSGFIDKTGQVAVPPRWEFVLAFSEGAVAVEESDGGPWYFLDKTGRKLHGGRSYEDARSYAGGLAAVKIRGQWGAVDHEGRFVVEPAWDDLGDYCPETGLIPVSRGGDHGFVDRGGELVIALAPWDEVGRFHEELALVVKDGKHGFLDPTGKLVVPCEWDDSGRRFVDGLCPVSRDGRWGYIDSSGKVAIPLQWKDAWSFQEGLARVQIR